jgi:hypothetical protein
MKKYTTPRPAYTTYVQWDGNNIAEFEALTGADWPSLFWNTITFVENAGNLEMWRGDTLISTMTNGQWACAPNNIVNDVELDQSDPVLEGNPPFVYIIE